jgi:hypothetical protein
VGHVSIFRLTIIRFNSCPSDVKSAQRIFHGRVIPAVVSKCHDSAVSGGEAVEEFA